METKFSKEWDNWIDSEQGKECSKIESLQNADDNTFLINRLHNAFTVGWNAKESSTKAFEENLNKILSYDIPHAQIEHREEAVKHILEETLKLIATLI